MSALITANRQSSEIPLIELTGITKTYPGVVPVVAVKPTTLAIDRGDQVAIVGPSGSGKSTLLNLLGLLDAPSSGSYLLNGVELSDANELTRGSIRGHLFGFVFQSFHLLAGRSLIENVELGMTYVRIPAKSRRQRAAIAIEQLGLTHRMHADPRELSGGERQRAAIARAIAVSPSVLFCDEPTGNLDSKNSAVVMELLRGLNSDGLTLVLVTHDESVAASMNRIVTVNDGDVLHTPRQRVG